MNNQGKKLLLVGIATCGLLSLSLASLTTQSSLKTFAGYLFGDNFNVVRKDELTRSCTLGAKELESIVTKHKIKTIINLRGAHPEEKWWATEYRMAQKHNIALVNIPLTCKRMPTNLELRTLVAALQLCPKPVHIHCLRGADRTGLGCYLALWLTGTPHKEALKQLSMKFGHFKHIIKSAPAMEEFAKYWHKLSKKYNNDVAKMLDHYNPA